MTYASTLVAALVLPLILAGCDKKAEAPKVVAASESTPNASDMPAMGMAAGSRIGSGSGTVTAIDAAAGKITLDHGAIPAVGWPAMKMGFTAKPALLSGIAIGDKVEFEVTVSGGAGVVTQIKKH